MRSTCGPRFIAPSVSLLHSLTVQGWCPPTCCCSMQQRHGQVRQTAAPLCISANKQVLVLRTHVGALFVLHGSVRHLVV